MFREHMLHEPKKGFVYIITNPSFREDWVKIGKSALAPLMSYVGSWIIHLFLFRLKFMQRWKLRASIEQSK